jgi:acetyltransferase
VAVFLEALEYRRNRDLLMQTPPRVGDETPRPTQQADKLVRKAIAAGRTRLTEQECARVLSAYGIPALEPLIVPSHAAAQRASEKLGYPVTLKLLLRNGQGGYVIGAVAHDLEDAGALRAAAARLRKRLRSRGPGTGVRGFSVHASAVHTNACRLLVGVLGDPVFGPLIVLGESKRQAPAGGRCAIGLPPLDMALAQDLISRAGVIRTLRGSADRPPADLEAICLALIRVSQLICDIEEVAELEIDPLLADENGVLALESSMRLSPGRGDGLRRFAIRPYPRELEERVVWRDRHLVLRPIRPEDEAAHAEFLGSLDPADSRMRFFGTMRELPHSQLARFTQIDYDREMAILALQTEADGRDGTLGEVRAVTDPSNTLAEFALVVRSELKGQGLGTLLLCKMIGYCCSRGTAELRGETMADNERMLKLARNLGFELSPQPEERTVRLRLVLSPRRP